MAAARTTRLVEAALRCYPARWRRQHGDEAAELAALLIRDGTPPRSIAWSYLAGAARERLTPHPSRRVRMVACAVLVAVCSLGVSAGLLASAVPARAASGDSTSQGTGRTYCQPAPSVAPAVGRQQVNLGEAGHGRTC
jgi:hypothetical protein